MKNALIAIFAITIIALGAVCFLQTRKLTDRENQIVSLRAETGQQSREIADLQSSQKFLQQQSQELFDQSSQLAAKLMAQQHAEARAAGQNDAAPESTNAAARASKNPFGEFFAKMMDDPEMKKMMRNQQRAMLDQLYDPLMKQMGLSAEEAARFKELLADNMLKGTEKASALFGSESSTNRTGAYQKMWGVF